MKIVELVVPKPYLLRSNADRCSRKVHSYGVAYFSDPQKDLCGRLARFEVDGVKFCTQHAGEEALRHVFNNQF